MLKLLPWCYARDLIGCNESLLRTSMKFMRHLCLVPRRANIETKLNSKYTLLMDSSIFLDSNFENLSSKSIQTENWAFSTNVTKFWVIRNMLLMPCINTGVIRQKWRNRQQIIKWFREQFKKWEQSIFLSNSRSYLN